MERGAITVAAILALAGCASNGAKLEIRPSPGYSALAQKPASARIADGRAQLALGNVALALELFRKAERDSPGTVQALVGISQCYDRMGRYDLASKNLETALAREPHNPGLLKLLAASFALQGKHEEADAARSQSDALAAAPRAGSVTVRLPPARVAQIAETNPPPTELVSPPARSLTVPRPKAQQARSLGTNALVSPASLPPVRLERVSSVETVLVTSGRAPWARLTSAQSAHSKPLNRGASVRLLNAARHHGLAARTRISLRRRGWENIAIGDALQTRERSLILYSADNQPLAKRLATQFGFALAREPRPGRVTVLLGRDAVHSLRTKRT